LEKTVAPLSAACLLAILITGGLALSRDEFDAAIKASRGSLIDQVNPAKRGAPFFTVTTLNPIWEDRADTPIVRIPRIELLDQDGRKRNQSVFDGKVSIIAFAFTSCSGICPTLVAGLKKIEKSIGSGHGVRLVLLSVDPEHDSPKALKTYARRMHLNTDTNWLLLTGERQAIYSLAKETFVSEAFKRRGADPDIVHSEHFYVIDGQKRLRGVLNGTRQDAATEAKRLLEQLQVE
jgi:protein SCO1/2